MKVQFPEPEIRAKAIELGLIKDGDELPRSMRSRLIAALIQEQAPRFSESEAPPLADSIRVQPRGAIEVDGQPFPWLVQADRIEVVLEPDGSGMVRLTLPARSIEIVKPDTESE
ncbi:hypothetical protein [Streptomyces europaeiscabiei]|uniref:hypothetical protein n=1 Tax=Streptomyces europaeiscabiei TaxID=146819 RepID=UPI0029AD8FA0|nr:hypothetical protein [Streptomyces europaeiscabiei]MDX2528058.1 hypothetical protein [Streptomyces europaeiscabiei]MDX3839552.1 hypothetical protein [Streptomyces europaeiscabiei]